LSIWRQLEEELDRWPPGQATLWWRDDDATAPSPALDRLLGLSEAPLALAAIPAFAGPELAGHLAGHRRVAVLQHGFAHVNHEAAGQRKMELGAARPTRVVLDELARGWRKLSGLFGQQALPVLVPPWNRIAAALVASLPGRGYCGLSAWGARPHAAPDGLLCVNTHIDVIAWRAGRSFIGPEAAIDQALRHFGSRREGAADLWEPTGLLTHHLAMGRAAVDFVAELLARTAHHPSARWCAADEIFRPGRTPVRA
jgi:hypothetical protein